MKTFETVKIGEQGRVVTVSLNRPDVRNAFHPTMIRELTEAFEALSVRTDISVIILRGEGKSFCAGADLGYMHSMAKFSFAENEADSQQLFGMFWALRSCPHPVVGRLHGHVMGGALGLTALCDVAAATSETQFCFSEVKLGLAPAVISPFVLERMQIWAAKRYMVTAEVFGVEEARASGLVQFIGNETEVDAFVAQIADTISKNGPESVRATKALIRNVEATDDWNEKRAMTTKLIAERRVSAEGQSRLHSFLDKQGKKS